MTEEKATHALPAGSTKDPVGQVATHAPVLGLAKPVEQVAVQLLAPLAE